MRLISVYRVKAAPAILYNLLRLRPKEANISHRRMPTLKEHLRFMGGKPYRAWYLIKVGDDYVGSITLSRDDEVGVALFAWHWGRGYGPQAIKLLMSAHPRDRFLANVSPRNPKSIRLFQRLGFRWIQSTYELRP